MKQLLDRLLLLLTAITVLFLFYYNVGYCARVKGESMYPSLSNGDIIFINRYSKELSTSNIVAINSEYLKTSIVKRIDSIDFNNSCAWVLGDNRPVSIDSREFGFVSFDKIEGRVYKVIDVVKIKRLLENL